MSETHEIVLTGCSPTPLASYLKGLGVLRLVSDQADPSAAGRWSGDVFVLRSKLEKSQIREFFLNDYAPTPIISPWSGRAGFLEGENASTSTRKGATIVREVSKSFGRRFTGYRTILNEAHNVQVLSDLNEIRAKQKEIENRKRALSDDEVNELKALKAKGKKCKSLLLLSLRAEMSDLFLRWLDACFVLTGDNPSIAPLLGSGGNEGSMDFSINHLGHLKDLIDLSTDQPTSLAASTIDQSLSGEPSVISKQGNPGFLNPGVASGPNMGNGFEGKTGDNPWNTVLMLEGIILFAAAMTKKSDSASGSSASFPFIFETSRAGHGSIGSEEKSTSEFWAPMWKSFASVQELQALFSEGRTTVGRRVARNGLDMVRSVNLLGVDRGLHAFERYGFFERRGQGYSVAAPMGRFPIDYNTASGWIDELERNDWLTRFRRFSQGKNTANRFVELLHRLENTLFVMAQRKPSPGQTQSLLILLGEIQSALSRSIKAHDKVTPVPQLSAKWVQEANDEGPEFRIACALAGLRGLREQPLPIRSQLFPVHHLNRNEWLEKVRSDKSAQHNNAPACRIRLHITRQRNLELTLTTLLQTRLSLPARLGFADKPLNSSVGVDLADLMHFLASERMDAKILGLLPGLSLCKIPESPDKTAGDGEIHAAYALCKLALMPDATLHSLGFLQDGERVPVPPQLVSKLASGDREQARQAVEIAWKRLRSSGLEPVMPLSQVPDMVGIDSRRLAAALLIPLNFGTTSALAGTVLESAQDSLAEAS